MNYETPSEKLMRLRYEQQIKERKRQSGITALSGGSVQGTPQNDIWDSLNPTTSTRNNTAVEQVEQRQMEPEDSLIDKVKLGIMDNSPEFIADIVRPERSDTEDTLSWYEAPLSRVEDGKRFPTRSTEINEDNAQVGLSKMYEQINKNRTDDKRESFVYGFKFKDIDGKEQVKFGVAKNGFEDRYKDNPYILKNAKVFLNERVKNANQIEREWNGSRGSRNARSNDWGNGAGGRFSGATEFLDPEVLLEQKEGETQQLLTDEQKTIANPEIVEIKDRQRAEVASRYQSVVDKYQKMDENTGMLGSFSIHGSGSLEDVMKDPEVGRLLSEVMAYNDDVDIEGMDEKEKYEKTQQFFSGETNNLSQMIVRATKLYNDDPEAGLKYLSALKIYSTTDLDPKQVANGIVETFKDVTTYLSLGVGAAAKKVMAKKAMEKLLAEMTTKVAAKQSSQRFAKIAAGREVNKKLIDNSVKVAAGAGAIEGAMYGGGFATAEEFIGSNAEQRPLDWENPITATATGAVLGAALGASVAKVFQTRGVSKERAKKRAIELEAEFQQKKTRKEQLEFIDGLSDDVKKEVVDYLNNRPEGFEPNSEFTTKKVDTGRVEESEAERLARIGQEGTLQKMFAPEDQRLDIETGKEIKNKSKNLIMNPVRSAGDAKRNYNESLNSEKTGEVQTIQFQDIRMKNAKDKNKHIDDLLTAYDQNDKQRETWGGIDTRAKGQHLESEPLAKAKKLEFEIEQTRLALDDVTPGTDEWKRLEGRLFNAEKTKKQIRVSKADKEISKRAEKEYYSQEKFDIPEPSIKVREKLQQELTYLKEDLDEVDPTDFVESIKKKLEETDLETRKEVDKQYIKSGKRWNKMNFNRKNGKISSKTKQLLRDRWGRENDIKQFEAGEITIEQFQIREANRIAKDGYSIKYKRGTEEQIREIVEKKAMELEDVGARREADELRKISIQKPFEGKTKKKENKWTKEREKERKEAFRSEQASKAAAYEEKLMEYQRKLKEEDTDGLEEVFTLGKLGNKKIGKLARKLMSSGVDAGAISRMMFPEAETKAEAKKLFIERRGILSGIINKKNRKRLMIKKEEGIESNRLLKSKRTILDAKASNAQILGALLKSKNMLDLTNMTKNNKAELRQQIAEKIRSSSKEFGETTDKFVKETFVPTGYGQGAESAVKQLIDRTGWKKEKAERFFEEYDKAYEETIPEMKLINEIIADMLKRGKIKSKISFTALDGTKINLDLTKDFKAVAGSGHNKAEMSIKNNLLDKMSKKILPAIIQSTDASIMRAQNKKGFKGKHDATAVNNLAEEKIVKDTHLQEMTNIVESGLLDKIFNEIGYEGSITDRIQKEIGFEKATKDDLTGKNALGAEYRKDELILSDKKTEIKDDVIKSNDELIKETFIKGNPYRQEADELIVTLTTQSGYRDLSRQTKDQSVIERMVALAHNKNKLSKEDLVSLTKQIGRGNQQTVDVMKKTFEEIRAKLELNPLTKSELKGDFLYSSKFNERDSSGALVKTYKQTYDQIAAQMKDEWVSLSPEAKRILMDKDKRQLTLIKDSITTGNLDRLTDEQKLIRAELVEISRPKLDLTHKYGFRQTQDTEEMKTFNKWDKKKRFGVKEVVRETNILKTNLQESFKKDKINEEEFTKKVLHSGYLLVRGKTLSQIERTIKENGPLLQSAKKYIEQSAAGLGNKSEQYGYYRNSSYEILDELKITGNRKKMAEVLDTMIGWERFKKEPGAMEFVDKNSKKTSFKKALAIIDEERVDANDVFGKGDRNKNRMFFKEVYKGMKNIDGTWRTEKGRQEGLLPAGREQLTVGKLQPIKPPKKFKRGDNVKEWAQRNKLKITNSGIYSIADLTRKETTGLSYNASEIIAKTQESTKLKIQSRKMMSDIKKELTTNNSIMSATERHNFVKIKKEDLAFLPNPLPKRMTWVHKDFYKAIVGKNDSTIMSKDSRQIVKIVDRLWKDVVMKGKQNMVIKNVPSFKNALFMGVTVGMSSGVRPDKIVRSMARSVVQQRQIKKLIQEKIRLRYNKKDTSAIDEKLNNIPLYKMEKAGLATNMLDGVVDEGSLLDEMLGRRMPRWINATVGNLMFNQNRTSGKIAGNLFSTLDTMSRFALAEHHLAKGMNLEDAVRKGNAPFADMEQIAPDIVDRLDNYGLVMFAKWFTQSAPGIMDIAKNNKATSLATAVGIYMLGQELNQNTSGYNPLESMADFGEQILSTPSDALAKMNSKRSGQLERVMLPILVPALYTKPYFKMKYDDKLTRQDAMNIIFPKKIGRWHQKAHGELLPHDMRGVTDVIVQDVLGVRNPTTGYDKEK